MKQARIFVICFCAILLALGMKVSMLGAAEEYKVITVKDLGDNKKILDDPRPYLVEGLSYKKMLPPGVYAKLSYDVEEMKKLWAEIVGFKAPDVVGKIAPEIKPGTYSYQDKEKYPGIKALMTEDYYKRFNPGAPPFAGNFREIKVVPTRQYYRALPVAEATKKYMGKTELDEKTGIIKEETYVSGFPFPRPGGNFKANQVMYNWSKRYWGWDSQYMIQDSVGWTGGHKQDNTLTADGWMLKLKGRVMEPYGCYDERAKEQGEDKVFSYKFYAPRDMFGNVISSLKYLSPDKYDQMMLYINALRRVRLMSATDVQDVVGGADTIYCDSEIFSQKLSTTVFPSKCEIIAERELLLPVTSDGSSYIDSKELEYHNLEWERRPVYVVKMTMLDKNFVYGHRILYFDMETFMLHFIENYDQKGRLYRTSESVTAFFPEMGVFHYGDNLARDHLDTHSSFVRTFFTPYPSIDRTKVGLGHLTTKGK